MAPLGPGDEWNHNFHIYWDRIATDVQAKPAHGKQGENSLESNWRENWNKDLSGFQQQVGEWER